jgi:hypothetical protein
MLQVVKAFVTLTEPFKMTDKEQLAKELQEHAKKVTAPYKYPRKVRLFVVFYFEDILNSFDFFSFTKLNPLMAERLP